MIKSIMYQPTSAARYQAPLPVHIHFEVSIFINHICYEACLNLTALNDSISLNLEGKKSFLVLFRPYC